MKKKMDKFSKMLLVMTFVGMFALLPIALVAIYSAQIIPDSFMTVYFTLIGILIVIFLISFIIFEKRNKKEENKRLEETKRELEKGPKDVVLKDFPDIPKECIKCQAEVNENGKITCKVHFEDLLFEIESYEEFSKHFSFVEK